MEVLLVVSQTGFCIAYIIFIHDTLPNVVPAVSPLMVMAVIVPVQVCYQLAMDVGGTFLHAYVHQQGPSLHEECASLAFCFSRHS